MKIALFEIEPWEEKIVRQRLKGHKLLFSRDPISPSNIHKYRDVDAITVFIYSAVTADLIERLTKLKYVATMSTGFDHIDITKCKKRGIFVSNVPFYGENTVAEHTFALILALSRKLVQSINNTRRGNFSLDGLRGFDLKGKSLGVIGTGHIGLNVIRIAKGFEMRVVASDVQPNKDAKKLGFEYVSTNELLKRSDIVTLHCPYNTTTHHIINSNTIKYMKKNSILINTARGSLIETTSLMNALQEGTIAGAGLDVLEEELAIKEEKQLLSKSFNHNLKTVLGNHILMHLDNVVITPHSAFNSTEALERILETTIDNLQGFIKKKPQNKIF